MKKILLSLVLMLSLNEVLKAQGDPQQDSCLIAKYYFNWGNVNDDHVGAYHGTQVGATLVSDRFGNPNAAWYLNGTPNSYINLGTYSALKPTTLSVSMWLNITAPVYSCSGYSYNPILLTKTQTGNNCWESYCFYYDMFTNKIAIAGTRLPCNQPCVWTPSAVSSGTWHHLVFTFDNTAMNLYLDAVLQGTAFKGFSQVYLAGDSVMVGNSANISNDRYFNGTVDDMRFYQCVLSQTQVTSLYNEPNPVGPTGIKSLSTQMKTNIYPNPTSGEFTLTVNKLNENSSIEIYNTLGQIINNVPLTNLQTKIDLREQAEGIYFIRVLENAKPVYFSKVVKQ